MQEGQNARQQVVERIRQSTSIMVAVGNNPSVDALAASLGLSLMLNKMNKHTTAVFSGQTPPAIQFLEPNKLFENNVDALRDFIISLDKEKADRLRYKVEDDVVRIFITPYKTSISEKDLQYSQGDFNVDLIIALGVEKRDDLDKAIIAHGRILHDATVVTVNASAQKSGLGAIDWNDEAASSLCEMLVGVSEAFQQPGLLDQQISTALLTGIVANTERFSNNRTSPRVMTMAAQLMAAGANQQLIATNLSQASVVAPKPAGPVAKQEPTAAPAPLEDATPKKEPGELDIIHPPKSAEPPKPEPKKEEPVAALAVPIAPALPQRDAEAELEAALPAAQVSHNVLPDIKKDLEEEANKAEAAAQEDEDKAPGGTSVNAEVSKVDPEHEEDYISSHGSWKGKRLEPPTLGGTLNATTEEAMEESHKAEEEEHNKVLLTHPTDANQQQDQPRSRRNRRGRGGGDRQQQQPQPQSQAAPVVIQPPRPASAPIAPAPEPVAVPAPQPAPEPMSEPVPQPEPTPAAPPELPPQPTLEPLPPMSAVTQPEPTPAPDLPPVPPMPISEPISAPEPVQPAPAPMPEPMPAPDVTPQPDLDALNQEAAASAAEAAAVAAPTAVAADTVDNARQAVSDALESAPFSAAGNPSAAIGAQAVPAMPDIPVVEPPRADAPPATVPEPNPSDLPPMPPMPPLPSSDMALPPAPDLPGLSGPLPPIADMPGPEPTPPTPQPPTNNDPAQFKIPGAP